MPEGNFQGAAFLLDRILRQADPPPPLHRHMPITILCGCGVLGRGRGLQSVGRDRQLSAQQTQCAFRPTLLAVAGLASGLPTKHPVRKGKIPDHNGHDDRSANTDEGKRWWG